MDVNFLRERGFKNVDSTCILDCNYNSKLKPLYQRYAGMGNDEIIASIEDKYLLFWLGGSNGYDALFNLNAMKKLTYKDAVTFEELKKKVLDSIANNL